MSSRSIVVVEDEEDEKNKKHPIVDSCCGCCSLGAGCLLIAIIYLGLGVSFIITRSDQLTVFMGKKGMLWSGGSNIFLNIWRLMLIVGMFIAVTSLIGCGILAVASCLWGHKESYKKLQKSVIIWCVLTSLLIAFNAGEVVYVVLSDSSNMRVLYDLHVHTPQENLMKMIIMAAVHAGFFIYFVIVLVSYLRLLKYKKISKLGGADYQEKKKTSPSVMEEKYYDLARTSVVTSETDASSCQIAELPVRPAAGKKKTPVETCTKPSRDTTDHGTTSNGTTSNGTDGKGATDNGTTTTDNGTTDNGTTDHSTTDHKSQIIDPVRSNIEVKDQNTKENNETDLHQHIYEEAKTNPVSTNECEIAEEMKAKSSEVKDVVVKDKEISATTQMFLSVIYDLPPLEGDSEDEGDLPIKIEDLSLDFHPKRRASTPDACHSQIQTETRVESGPLSRDLVITEVEPPSSTTGPSHSVIEIPGAGDGIEAPEKEKERRELEDVPGRPASRAHISIVNERKEEEEINELTKKEEDEEEEMNEEEIKRFFQFLSAQPHNLDTEDHRRDADPIEKMFRMFGGELCKQNPQLCSRYFKAYKNASHTNKRMKKDDTNEENILHKLTMMEEQYQERMQNQLAPEVPKTAAAAAELPTVLPANLSQTDPFYKRMIMDTSNAKRGYQENAPGDVVDDPTMGFHLPSRLSSQSKSMMTSSSSWREDHSLPPPLLHPPNHHDFPPPPEYDPYYEEDPYTCSTCSGSTYGCYDDPLYDYGMFPPHDHHDPRHRHQQQQHHHHHTDPYDFKPFPNRDRWSLPYDPRDAFPMTSPHSSRYAPPTPEENSGIWIALDGAADESDETYFYNSFQQLENSSYAHEGGRGRMERVPDVGEATRRRGSFRSDFDDDDDDDDDDGDDNEYVMTRNGLMRKNRRNCNTLPPSDRRSSDPTTTAMRGRTHSSPYHPLAPRRSYDAHPADAQRPIMTSSSHNGHHNHSFDHPDERFSRASSRNSSRRHNSTDVGLRGRVTSTDSSKTLTSSSRRYNHNDFDLPRFSSRSMTSSHIRGQRSLGGSVTDLHRFSRKF